MNDPIPGDVWDAADGTAIYVIARKPKTVLVRRDSQADQCWMRLATFDREAEFLRIDLQRKNEEPELQPKLSRVRSAKSPRPRRVERLSPGRRQGKK